MYYRGTNTKLPILIHANVELLFLPTQKCVPEINKLDKLHRLKSRFRLNKIKIIICIKRFYL